MNQLIVNLKNIIALLDKPKLSCILPYSKVRRGIMAKVKKIAKYTKSIPIRFSEEDWHKIVLAANKEKLEASTWIRQQILKILNRKH